MVVWLVIPIFALVNLKQMATMKHFLNIFFSEELALWQSYNHAARLACLYLGISLIVFALCVMTGSFLPIIIALVNLVIATNVASIYIPNFYENK